MAQQTDNDLGAIPPSLEAKLRVFVDGLTPEEAAQVHTLQTEDATGMLSPSLWEKAEQAAGQLTPEEQGQLHLLLDHARSGAAAGVEADVDAFMHPLYDDSRGYKGRPGSNPAYNQPGGGSLSRKTFSQLTTAFVGGVALAFGALTQGSEP